jgi:hypothetical protein
MFSVLDQTVFERANPGDPLAPGSIQIDSQAWHQRILRLRSGLGRGCAITPLHKIIVDGRQSRQLLVAEAMQAMMPQRQLSIATLHTGTGTLKEFGALLCHLFNGSQVCGCQPRQRTGGAVEGCQ